MCGGKPKAPKESAYEQQQAQTARARMQEWETDGYKGLEKAAIAEAGTDYSSLLERKATADLAQASSTGYMPQNPGMSGKGIQSQASAALMAGAGAKTAGLKLQDNQRLNVVKTGRDVAVDSTSALGEMANRGARQAQADFDNKQTVANARGQAIGSLLTVGGAMGMEAWNKPNTVKTDWTTDPNFNPLAMTKEQTMMNYDKARLQGRGGR